MHDNSSAQIHAKAISLFKLKVAFITKLTVFLYWQEKLSSATLENVTQIKIRRQLKLKFPKIKGQFNPYVLQDSRNNLK